MTLTIYTLTTDDGTEATTTVHTSFAALAACLRENFDPEGDHADVPDEDLQDVLANGGLIIVTDSHEIDVPFPDTPVNPVYLESAIDDLDVETADAIAALGPKVHQDALDEAFDAYRKDYAFMRTQVVADAVTALEATAADLA